MTKLQTNDFWHIIIGAWPGVLTVDGGTPESDIVNAAKSSVNKPSIAASKDDLAIVGGSKADVDNVTSFHGHALLSHTATPCFHDHAMIGVQGPKIKLYDPAKVKELQVTPAELKRTMKAIVFQK